MRFGSFEMLAAAFSALSTSAAAFASENSLAADIRRVDVLAVCKQGTACIAAELMMPNVGQRRIGTIENDVCEGPIVKLRGRLNSGAVRAYSVGLPGTCGVCEIESVVAYVGHSKAGNPMVQTAKGTLEIVDRGVKIGHPGELIMIQARTGKIEAAYWGPTRPSGSNFYFEDGNVFLADGDGPCFVAPRGTPRAFAFAPGHCRDRGRKVPLEAVDTTNDALEATLRKIGGGEIPGGGTFVKAPGTDLFALETADPC